MPAGRDVAADLETLASIRRQLDQALARLVEATTRSAGLAEETSWRTGAATLFRLSADEWRREVAAAAAGVEDARDEVDRARGRLAADAGTDMW